MTIEVNKSLSWGVYVRMIMTGLVGYKQMSREQACRAGGPGSGRLDTADLPKLMRTLGPRKKRKNMY